MALPLMLARLLEPNAFGVYKQFFMVATSLLMLGQVGLTQSLYYFLPREGAARGSYLAQTAAILWPLGAFLGIALFVLAPPLADRLGIGGLVALRGPLAVTVACLLMAAPLEPALTSDGRTRAAALSYVVTEAARALALIGGARLGMRWLWPAAPFWGAAAVAALRVVALVVLAAWRVLPLAPPRRDRLRAQLAFALPFAGASLLYVGQRFSPQYLVSARFDAATFALFSVASFHLGVVELVFAPVTEVLMVQLGRTLGRDAAASVVAFDEAVKTLASLLFPATCGAWLLGPTVLPMLFTSRYNAAVPLFMLTTVEIPLCVLPVDALLRAAGDTRFLLGFNVARLLGTIALVAAGIEFDGLAGAIIGAIAGESLARLALLARGRRYLGVRSTAELLDGPWLARVALASVLACAPAWLTVRCLGPGVAAVVAAVAAYGMSYAVLRQLLIRRAPPAVASPPAQPQPADCA
jgi:O-antigen/teichoic acid export membrane protein